VRVLGIDPGYHRMGLAVVDYAGSTVSLAYSALEETNPECDFAERLALIHECVRQAIVDYFPEAVAVEEIYFSRNVKTAIGVAQARGVILLAAAQAGLPVFEYKPVAVKQAITSNGQADKSQVAFMVARLTGLDVKKLADDEIDAVAVALCHAFKRRERVTA